jgi:hypothetical protein
MVYLFLRNHDIRLDLYQNLELYESPLLSSKRHEMINWRIFLSVAILCLGLVVLAASVSLEGIHTSSTPTRPCGGGDMPPCSPGQIPTQTTVRNRTNTTSEFTPVGCTMTGGIVSCTVSNSTTALQYDI